MYGLGFLFLLVPLALLAILVFEIMMFLDVIKNRRLSDNEKLLWVLGMLLVHPVIAIVYYYVAHSRLKR